MSRISRAVLEKNWIHLPQYYGLNFARPLVADNSDSFGSALFARREFSKQSSIEHRINSIYRNDSWIRSALTNPSDKDIGGIETYLEDRLNFFTSDMPEEVYKSLMLYIWYVKLKNTCPITGTIIGTEVVDADTFSSQFDRKEFTGLVQLLYSGEFGLLSLDDINSMERIAPEVSSIFEYIPVLDRESRFFEYEESSTNTSEELLVKCEDIIRNTLSLKMQEVGFDGNLSSLKDFLNNPDITLSVKYQHLQLLYWVLIGNETSKAVIIKKLNFIKNKYHDQLQLDLSILPTEDILEIGHLSQSFKTKTSLFTGVGLFEKKLLAHTYKQSGSMPLLKELLLQSNTKSELKESESDIVDRAFIDALELAITNREQMLKRRTKNEIELVYELYIFASQNPWNNNFVEYANLKKEFPYKKVRHVPKTKWEIIKQERTKLRSQLEEVCHTNKDKMILLDYFAEKLLLGEHDALIAIDIIQAWYEELGWAEMFECSLNTFCKRDKFSSIKEQVDWIRCVSVLRSYFPTVTNKEAFIAHCQNLQPPVYMVN